MTSAAASSVESPSSTYDLATRQSASWRHPRDDPHGPGRALRLVRAGRAGEDSLLHHRPEHRIELEVLAPHAVGAREGREPLPFHAARTGAPAPEHLTWTGPVHARTVVSCPVPVPEPKFWVQGLLSRIAAVMS